MRLRSWPVLVVLVVCVSGVSCGSSEPGEEEDTGPIEQPCASYAASRCALGEQCTPVLFGLEHGSAETCRSNVAARCMYLGGLPGVKLGPKSIGACASTLAGLSCEGWEQRVDVAFCSAPAGKLGTGAPCLDGYQCSSRVCFLDAGGVCGTCQAALHAGDGCRLPMDCPSGTTCSGYKCVAAAKTGEPCDAEHACAGTLLCSEGKCVSSPGVGEPCAAGVCNNKLGLNCDAASGLCEGLTLAGEGEACGAVGTEQVYCSGKGSCTSQHVCTSPAPEDRPCDEKQGPTCEVPAVCMSGWCKVPDPAACQ